MSFLVECDEKIPKKSTAFESNFPANVVIGRFSIAGNADFKIDVEDVLFVDGNVWFKMNIEEVAFEVDLADDRKLYLSIRILKLLILSPQFSTMKAC